MMLVIVQLVCLHPPTVLSEKSLNALTFISEADYYLTGNVTVL